MPSKPNLQACSKIIAPALDVLDPSDTRSLARALVALEKGLVAPVVAIEFDTAAAQDTPEKRRQAFADLQMEYSVCIAYYNMEKICAPDELKAKAAHDLDPIIKTLTETAYLIGSKIGMTNEAMGARLKMSYDDAGQRMRHSCINFAAEYERHGQRCKLLAEHPDQIFYEYMNN
jgi:hypothetical protein